MLKKKKVEASPITPCRLLLISHDDSLTVVLCKLSLCLMSGKKKKKAKSSGKVLMADICQIGPFVLSKEPLFDEVKAGCCYC